jgi:hypothetical protein
MNTPIIVKIEDQYVISHHFRRDGTYTTTWEYIGVDAEGKWWAYHVVKKTGTDGSVDEGNGENYRPVAQGDNVRGQITIFNQEFIGAVREQFPGVEVQNCDFLDLGQTHGYKMRFVNGLTVSVQFGPATYSTHYDRTGDFVAKIMGRAIDIVYVETATEAEIAGWYHDEEFHDFGWDDFVKGYQSPEAVLAWLKEVAR